METFTLGIAFFTMIVISLVTIIMFAKSKLVSSGDVTIRINGEKTVTPVNPLSNGWSYTGHVTWSFACRYIFVFEQCCTVHLSACLSLIRAGAVTVRGGG